MRPLTSIPFAPGATTLRFQPKFSSIVLATSASGAFLLTDVQGGGIDFQGYQVTNVFTFSFMSFLDLFSIPSQIGKGIVTSVLVIPCR